MQDLSVACNIQAEVKQLPITNQINNIVVIKQHTKIIIYVWLQGAPSKIKQKNADLRFPTLRPSKEEDNI